MRFSRPEVVDITKAWVAISIAFGIVISHNFPFFYSFIISALTVGIGFLLHELAHKMVAQNYGYRAEFHSFDQMLLLAIFFSFFGFVFAAPGAVFISGKVNKKKNGIVSLAGPLTNLILASLFFTIGVIVPSALISYGFLINSWLAFFNLLPFWQLDGKKVFNWSKLVYFLTLAIAFIFVFM